jgi:hypothetical protein
METFPGGIAWNICKRDWHTGNHCSVPVENVGKKNLKLMKQLITWKAFRCDLHYLIHTVLFKSYRLKLISVPWTVHFKIFFPLGRTQDRTTTGRHTKQTPLLVRIGPQNKWATSTDTQSKRRDCGYFFKQCYHDAMVQNSSSVRYWLTKHRIIHINFLHVPALEYASWSCNI